MKARRVVWPEAGRAEVEDFTLGEPGPGEVLLQAERTLISPGTERAFLLGLPNTSGHFPQRPGYNFTGRVLALGAGVEGLRQGQRVAASAPHASHALQRAAAVLPVADEVAPEAAVFFNMGAIALQGVRRARIGLGEGVAVVGQGLVGLLAVQLCRLQGGLPVLAVDPLPARLELSRACGADWVASPQEAEAMARAFPGGGPAVVVEATGHPEPVNAALAMARAGGRVVLLASTRGVTQVNFYRDVHRKGLAVLGAHNSARPRKESGEAVWTWEEDAAAVLALMAYGRLHLEGLVTHRFAGEQAASAYALLAEWDPGLLGVVLQWSEGA